MTDDVRRSLGRLTVQLSGSLDPIASHVYQELASLPRTSDPAHLIISFDGLESSGGRPYVKSGPVAVSDSALTARYKRFRLDITEAEGVWRSSVASDLGPYSKRGVSALVRLADHSFLNAEARLGKTFFYAVFDQLTQLRQLPLGQTWAHASAVTNDSRTLGFFAWGGVGKTSIMLKLLESGSWRFLADDLLPIDDAGMAYLSPKRMQVYAYNTVGEDALRDRLLAGRSRADLAHWHARRRMFGTAKVRRRISPGELFGEAAVGGSGHLTDAVLLRRVSGPFSHSEISADALASACSHTLLQELNLLTMLIAAAGATGEETILPDMRELEADTRRILRAAVTDVQRRVILNIPMDAAPGDIAEYTTATLGL